MMGKSSLCSRGKKIAMRILKTTTGGGSLQPSSRGSLTAPKLQLVEGSSTSTVAVGIKGKKKKLWMLVDSYGNSEMLECDKTVIMKRAAIPARDLRILIGPVFSQSSSILARENVVVINIEFVRAIITAEEVLIVDPLSPDVIPFVDQLKRKLPIETDKQVSSGDDLPFEFQVLEIALEIICAHLDSSVIQLEKDAYPALDELAKRVSVKNLEHVRWMKTNLTRLLARIQKVRDELEHLLDDNEDMNALYLTRKQTRTELLDTAKSNSISTKLARNHPLRGSNQSEIATTNNCDVEDLEMLLEAYFMQLDGSRNKILSLREYIDDTEDYVNIQLDSKRNELIQIQLILTTAQVPVSVQTMICGIFSSNIPSTIYNVQGIFGYFVGGMVMFGLLIFIFILGYAKWRKLLN